jgi:hypothetical protein
VAGVRRSWLSAITPPAAFSPSLAAKSTISSVDSVIELVCQLFLRCPKFQRNKITPE